MRIAYWNYLYDADGVSLGSAVKIRRLAQGLEVLGHQVETAWLNPWARIEPGTTAPHRRPLRQRFHRWLATPKALLRNVVALPGEQRLLSSAQPDVLVIRLDFCRLSASWLARRFGIPVVIDADAPIIEEQRRFHPEHRIGKWIAPTAEQWVLRRADGVFCPSSVCREILARGGIPAERIDVVPNGADLVEPSREERERIRSELGFEPEHRVIGFVGAFNRFHGIENLVSVIPELLAHEPKLRFLLVGGGGDREPAVQTAANRHPEVLATGRVQPARVRELLLAMDVGVAPYSQQADFYFSPVKVFEYLAAGIPVVGPALGQIAELVDHGRSGLLYGEPGTKPLLESLLQAARLSEEEVQAFGDAARETIRSSYTWRHAAQRVEAVLQRAVQES
ncbi:MAG: glycosyltransferase family 4 protein [Planctomycetota bacterium]